jgi:hypothetical protein
MTERAQLTRSDLMRMSQRELDARYREVGTPGSVPKGETAGTVMILPGSPLGAPLRTLARLLLWQGKVFVPSQHDLKNRISPLRRLGIRAQVYQGTSWLDGGPSTIIDYSQTSLVARWIRDEIREVGPNLWMGKVFVRRWHAIDFVLEA